MFLRLYATMLICLGFATANAQINLNYEKPDIEFERALRAYEKGLYNKSIRGFERYIKSGASGDYVHEAEYYIVSAKLRVDQTNAYEYAKRYLDEHPVSQRSEFVKKEIADYFFYKSKFKMAAQYYKQVNISILDRDETDEFLFRKGYSLFEAGKYDDAKDALYPLTLRPTKNFAKATYYYGYVCYKTGDYASALDAFLKIEDKGPQSMKLYICQMYYLKGEYKKAIEYADKTNLGKLEDAKNVLKGRSYYRLNDFSNAANYFAKGYTSYDSLNEDELYEIGYAYYKTQRCSEAFVAFSKIANLGTALAQMASYHLGECFINEGKKQNAYNAFFEAQRTDFDKEIKENAMYSLAKIAFELEDYKTAIATFSKFIESFPQSRNKQEAQTNLAKLFLVTNDYKSAIPILESIPSLDQDSRLVLHQILILRGEELVLNKDFADAKEVLQKAAKMNDNPTYTAIANFWLGEIEFNIKNKERALGYYQTFLNSSAAKETTYFIYANYAAGYCLFDLKRYAEALNYFNRYKSLNVGKPQDINYLNDVYLRVADCNYMLRNYKDAIDNYAYISAKKVAGSDYALFQQGMILGIQNKGSQKIAMMKRIPSEYPGSVYIEHSIYEVATEWMQMENYQEAERNFRYLLEDFPNSNYGKNCLLALGVMYYTIENDNQALDEFKRLVQTYPGTQESKSAIGYVERIYVSRGESDKYLSWLETVPNAGISVSFRDSVSYQGAFNLYMNNNCTGAIDNFRNYLREFPNGFFNISARFYLATCLNKVSENEESNFQYRYITESTPNEFRKESAKRLAVYYYSNENYDSSLYYYDKLETFSSEKQTLLSAYLGQIRCAFELSNLQITETKGLRLLRMDNIPQNIQGEVLNKIGVLYYESHDLVTANNYFAQTLKGNKDEYGAEAYYFTCQILFDNSDLATSKAKIFEYNKQFVAFEYWQARCFLLLAEIYHRESDDFQAKATLNYVIGNYDDTDILERANKLKSNIEGIGG
ncbi:MAG: tetratricopeptide repeat protein [Bacteroidetes bacterium]|nr:tetratricopeptide repeat protein [Bacteroidota bacterium]